MSESSIYMTKGVMKLAGLHEEVNGRGSVHNSATLRFHFFLRTSEINPEIEVYTWASPTFICQNREPVAITRDSAAS